MIKAENITKTFGKKIAINSTSFTVKAGSLCGIVGSNGAGKSTLLRMLAGVYKPDTGSITYGGKPIWDNPEVKEKTVFVSDEPYLPAIQSIKSMASMYKAAYKDFNTERLKELCGSLNLDMKASFNSFSKGMRRQAATILALSAMPDYLLLDETFDGLDSVMRSFVKQLIYEDMASRGTTVILTSHSLRELEDCSDGLMLLHRGGVVLYSELQGLKDTFFKVQIAFEEDCDKDRFKGLEIQGFTKTGKVASFILKGSREEGEAKLKAMNPVLLDILPLTLDEVFVSSLSALGYNFDGISL